MKEIGGYIEIETYRGRMLYDEAIKLNCGRNALDYIVKSKEIEKIWMPKFMCNSCNNVLANNGVQVKYYSIGKDFKPVELQRQDGEWLYLVNYYGQHSNDYIKTLGNNIIVDNAQAYFQEPIHGVDTLYTCRKFFGVADGSILFTDKQMPVAEQDESYSRMNFLLGRYEKRASEFYSEYISNNDLFANEPIKRMSKLTNNLLHGIDYDFIEQRRTENFQFLHERLRDINKLSLTIPKGAFMYPLYIENGSEVRRQLQKMKIYIPVLWPNVFDLCDETEIEYDMASNILPLPVDQRYTIEDMEIILNALIKYILL